MAERMVDFLQFLRVYGALMACAAASVVLAAVMASCTLRMKRLEKRVSEMEEALQKRMDDESRKNREDALRQRRVLSENMANLSESMTRAILYRDGNGEKA